jgi:hypothetical protein
MQNLGVGTVTITPTTSTINGASTLVLATNMGAFIWSDGTNYHAYFVPVSKPLLAANNGADAGNVDTMLSNLHGVSFGASQSLTSTQKAQAKSNVFVAPTTQTFLSGSGTATPSAGCLWWEVLLVGAAAGGAGSGSSGAGIGTSGGNTTLGGTLLVAGGGSVGAAGNSGGGVGGSPSFTAGPIILLATKGSGGGGAVNGVGSYPAGLAGAASSLGGAGAGGSANSAGSPADANSGSSGGGSSAGAGCISGAVGGAGATIRAIIIAPTALAYAVGAGGTGGTAGTSGNAGIAGAAGQIVIVEHYS